jgi:hypothetical protein
LFLQAQGIISIVKYNIFKFATVLVVAALSWWVIGHEQDIRDWWRLQYYRPSAEIIQLADDTDLSHQGERIFFVSRPQIEGRDQFNTDCAFPEHTLVLGCYSAQRIYVYDVTDERLSGIKEVTAAHEMLHAVYDRMSSGERERIDALTAQVADGLTDKRLLKTIESYRDQDPASVPNELHSILGTEVADLPAELEDHYAKYFNDRTMIINLSKSYESVFVAIEDKLDDIKAKIDALDGQINQAVSSLDAEKTALDAESNRLSSLRNNGDIAAYNAGVPAYNNRVSAFNEAIETYKVNIKKYNDLVAQYNDLAVTQNELVQSINSKFETISN